MCNDKLNDCNGCIYDILKVIFLLQENAKTGEEALESCDKGFLGSHVRGLFNTRPVVLYTNCSGNTPLSMPIMKTADEMTPTSTAFRIEKLDDYCCTFRVLEPNPDKAHMCHYIATNSLFTINVNCICIIRCLNDTFVEF